MATTSLYPRRRMAFLLGGCAGCLDAVGYLTFGLFVANMTGNTVLLGVFTGHAEWGAAGRALLVLVTFFAGAILSAVVMRRRRRLAEVLGTETLFLLAAAAVWVIARPHPPTALPQAAALPIIALLGAAMGMQGSAVRQVGEYRLSTTYVTGNLISLAGDAAGLFAEKIDGARGGTPARTGQGAPILFAVWASYLAGALVGGTAQYAAGFGAALLPTAVIAVLAGWDLRQHPTPG